MIETEKLLPLDRLGQCPNCETSWKGMEVYTHVENLDITVSTNDSAIANMAKEFGWTPETRPVFSKARIYEIGERIYYQCPKCSHVFNSKTGEHFNTIYDVRQREREDSIGATGGDR